MSNKEMTILNYIIICISEFSKQKLINKKDAYNYLRDYKGIDFLRECYEAEHTIGINDVIEDLTEVCKKNGGKIK